MKLNIPVVVRPIRLSDYAPEYGEQVVEMWVNPPREKRLEYYSITERYRDGLAAIEQADEDAISDLAEQIVDLANELYAWYADMWSQGADSWTVEEVREIAEAAIDRDPRLWAYLQERSLDIVGEYRRQKKASSPGPQG